MDVVFCSKNADEILHQKKYLKETFGMKNRKYSLVFIMLLCMIMAVSAFPMTVNADMGPKASVRIQFEHMGMSSVMELCCRRRNLLVRQVPGMEERRVPRKSTWILVSGRSL